MYACFHGHAGAVKVLLNAGADADYRNRAGQTALQLARKEGHEAATKAILDGPDIMVTIHIIVTYKFIVLYLVIFLFSCTFFITFVIFHVSFLVHSLFTHLIFIV